MKLERTVVAAVSIALSVAGCATASKDIASTYVSPVQYSTYDCAQLAAEAQRIQARVLQLGGRLDQAAQNDAGIMAVGIILFWPVLFALGGTKQQEAEFARLKGEYDAVEQASIAKKCAHVVPSVQANTQTPAASSPTAPASPPAILALPSEATVPSQAAVGQVSATSPNALSQMTPAATSTIGAVAGTSKYLLNAERYSKDMGCVSAVATMNIRAPTYETFSVTCSGGDPRSIRCDDGGACRELK
jgi:hypothetical protein